MAEAVTELSTSALTAAWERWIGPQRYDRKLRQFERLGWIQRRGTAARNIDAVLCVTERGRLVALGGRDPEACWARAWDGNWRLALFDVPEVRRSVRLKLGRKLRGLGFGCLQQSVWISPDPVRELRKVVQDSVRDVEVLTFMEARPCAGETDAEIVLGGWDFNRINRGYNLYLDILQGSPKGRPGSGPAWRKWFEVEWRAWTAAVKDDPLLPEPLLPRDYCGQEAWQRRRERLRRIFRVT